MKEKIKAKELVEKFTDLSLFKELKGFSERFEARKRHAIQCALIAVDEIIEAIGWHEFETPNKEFEFWQSVKNEIIKLK